MQGGYSEYRQQGWFCLVSAPWTASFSADWLLPEYWGQHAEPVTSGGRGSAWFIESDKLSAVLRHFSRGGLPRHLVEKHYLFTGRHRVRSVAEFLLLHELSERGLPVPRPIACGYRLRAGLSYRAAILMERIPDARPLSDYVGSDDESLWHQAGACIRRFHDAGVYHADLNCMNILVAEQIYLIDFDRGALRPKGAGAAAWKQKNLDRLLRSVNKCLAGADPAMRDQLWKALLLGYERRGGDSQP
jgi:3-deoxy-D-manno-octulosonic acid kinase